VAQENSSLNVYGGEVKIRRNDAGGLQALRNAFIRLQSAGLVALDAQINNNTGNGVEVNQDASIRFDQGTTIQNNTARGIWLLGGSHGNLSRIVVRNNDDDGIEAQDTSLQLTDSTLTGNQGDADLSLHTGTRVFLNGNTIGILPIKCNETVVSTGNPVCP
jgi:hypothetical protein